MNYILITSAYNEEKYIRKTIESVLQQKLLPLQWIIVNDDSIDGTEKIIQEYLEIAPFISYIHFKNPTKFSSNLGKVSKRVVACVNEAIRHIKHTYDYIGILDADISFKDELFAKLLQNFSDNKYLGLGGGYIYNVSGNKKWSYFTKPELVGGPLQLFRKECWEQIGGFYPGGHHDYYAVASCKMCGWEVRSYSELEILHLKNASVSGKSQIKAKFHLGQMDYVCGESFLYSLVRAITLVKSKPVLLGSIVRIAGYLHSAIRRIPKQVPEVLKSYLKHEQLKKILPFLR